MWIPLFPGIPRFRSYIASKGTTRRVTPGNNMEVLAVAVNWICILCPEQCRLGTSTTGSAAVAMKKKVDPKPIIYTASSCSANCAPGANSRVPKMKSNDPMMKQPATITFLAVSQLSMRSCFRAQTATICIRKYMQTYAHMQTHSHMQTYAHMQAHSHMQAHRRINMAQRTSTHTHTNRNYSHELRKLQQIKSSINAYRYGRSHTSPQIQLWHSQLTSGWFPPMAPRYQKRREFGKRCPQGRAHWTGCTRKG